MTEEKHFKEMAEKIQLLLKTATELKQISDGIETIDRNIDRILANVKMLELNVCDAAELQD